MKPIVVHLIQLPDGAYAISAGALARRSGVDPTNDVRALLRPQFTNGDVLMFAGRAFRTITDLLEAVDIALDRRRANATSTSADLRMHTDEWIEARRPAGTRTSG